jgi:hypothetical protein
MSGQPLHELTGGNAWVPWLLASTVDGSPNFSATNKALLGAGPASLTMNLTAGTPLNPSALLHASQRAIDNLQRAASIQSLTYEPATGALSFRVHNHTGHKLISGYPEGRRVFVNVQLYKAGVLVRELNPYDASLATLKGLSGSVLLPHEELVDALIYEAKLSSSLTGEQHTFHFVLADGRYKDNRVPPRGFRIGEAAARLAEPVSAGSSAPQAFTGEEYAGGYHHVKLAMPTAADGVMVRVFYQVTSREYIAALRSEIAGTAGVLTSPTPSGESKAYIAGTDPFFTSLRAWGETIWQLWEHNRSVPGAAPVLMADATYGDIAGPCALAGSEGQPCSDDDACTVSDVCASGACLGAPRECPAPDECHGTGVCESLSGRCQHAALSDGTPCSGGACESGVCVVVGNGGAGGAAAGGAAGAGGEGTGGLGGGSAGGAAGGLANGGGAGSPAGGTASAAGGTASAAGGTASAAGGSAGGAAGSAGAAPAPSDAEGGCACRAGSPRAVSTSAFALLFAALAVFGLAARRRRQLH